MDERAFLEEISKQLNCKIWQCYNALELFRKGATIPFIARYRKDNTGGLKANQLKTLYEKWQEFNQFLARREFILKSIESQGKLTKELKEKIYSCKNKSELEDLYLPYKPKKKTLATKAKEKGLEPLAKFIFEQSHTIEEIKEEAKKFINLEKKVKTIQEAIEGATYIIAEWISEDSDFRKWYRDKLFKEADIVVKATDINTISKYMDYYDFKQKIKNIPSHRYLAIRRGAKEGFLTYKIMLEDPEMPINKLKRKYIKKDSKCSEIIEKSIRDSFKRLIDPSIQTEVRAILKEKADEVAIKVFEKNLSDLLLSPYAGSIRVLGVDPGFKAGVKLAVVDETGKPLCTTTIHPFKDKKARDLSEKVIEKIIDKYKVEGIAIGNGTASREVRIFFKEVLKKIEGEKPFLIIVNEAGASIYSASDIAIEELPDIDISHRGAVSIARRLQDPLSELVKIDPKSIGIGQYQHDVNQKKLRESLERVVQICVNLVGVNLNTASWTILRYVSGINEKIAKNIVKYRNENGLFRNREELKKVSGIGEKTFQQAAGFLKIINGDNILDSTTVHPEAYYIVEKIANYFNISINELIKKSYLLDKLPKEKFIDDKIGKLTLDDIIKELKKPGRDPRRTFKIPEFNDKITTLKDIKKDMILEGIITNVTNFGAFIDLGLDVDGLIHISKISKKFVKDPKQVLKVGDIKKIKVIDVDLVRKRINCSLKDLEPQ